MATAAQKAELTKWFKPENYEGLKGITLEAFCQEFRLRRAMYEAYEEALESDEPELMVESVNQEEVALILSGEPLLTNKLTSHKNKGYDGDQHVRPLTAGKLYQFEKQIRETGLLTYKVDGSLQMKREDQEVLSLSVVSYTKARMKTRAETSRLTSEEEMKRLVKRAESVMPLVINIGYSTDEEIIESMRYLLTQWRKQTGIKPKTSKQSYGFGEVMVQKLIDFKIIPILDLLYHSNLHGYKLSDKDLERLMYRWGMEDSRDQVQIKETDRPLAKKALTRDFDNLFTMFLYKNRHLMDMKVRDVMELNRSKNK